MSSRRIFPGFLLVSLALCLLLGACATYTVIDDARQLFGEGRGEDALAILDKAASEPGADPAIRDDNGFSVEDWAKIEMSDGLAEVLDLLRRPSTRGSANPEVRLTK